MTNKITKKVALELIYHEAIVREAYKDIKGIWTWGIGITHALGHKVSRYINKPQSLRKCIEIFEWVLRKKYVPSVDEAFEGMTLSETEFAAALSFHYNTGAIKRASWVKDCKAGKRDDAYQNIMNWSRPPVLKKRRQNERDLFFNGQWANNGKTTEFRQVKKPEYKPIQPHNVDISRILDDIFDQ